MTGALKFSQLVATFNPIDIAFIKSLLDAEKIEYYLEGENFLQVRPLVSPARIMVESSRLDDAKELLKDYTPGKFGYKSD